MIDAWASTLAKAVLFLAIWGACVAVGAFVPMFNEPNNAEPTLGTVIFVLLGLIIGLLRGKSG
jgi:hypothetical protein